MHHPLKQGLRLTIRYAHFLCSTRRSASSIKTRIKTMLLYMPEFSGNVGVHHPLKQGLRLVLHSQIHSQL